jgi:hypothetical protein
MQANFFETFCLRLAAGLALALLALPGSSINPRFHRIQFVIVLGLAAAAATLAWHNAGDLYFLGVGLAAGACLIGSFLWTVRLSLAAGGSVVAVVVGLLLALASLHGLEGNSPGSPTGLALLLPTLDDLTAAAVLGLSTTAMLVGHWYLIAPTMSIDPLKRLILWLALALAVRMLMAGGQLAVLAAASTAFDQLAWLWVGLRWGVGFLGAGLLCWMAWQTARIRSTQSATGILYVVTIFCFFGELTDQLLSEHLHTLTTGG